MTQICSIRYDVSLGTEPPRDMLLTMNFYKTESDFSKRELPFHGCILNRTTT
jgi:hypothetical protein